MTEPFPAVRALNRRQALLGLGTVPLALSGIGSAIAQTSNEPAGAAEGSGDVYLSYSQAELDDAYDQRVWAPNAREMIARYKSESAAARRSLEFSTHAYGPDETETLDAFSGKAAGGPAPIHVHLHGGAWKALTKDDVSFLAPQLVAAGAVFVALNFATMPEATLPQMMAQCRKAVAWLHANAADLGGDPNRIHVSGHSSGAHMAGVLMATDWEKEGLPRDVLKSGLLISGMYDLTPVMLSSRADYVKLTPNEIEALSPITRLDEIVSPLAIVYGSRESPEFQRQSRDFAAALAKAGKTNLLVQVPDRNHFEMPFAVLDRSSLAFRAGAMLMSG